MSQPDKIFEFDTYESISQPTCKGRDLTYFFFQTIFNLYKENFEEVLVLETDKKYSIRHVLGICSLFEDYVADTERRRTEKARKAKRKNSDEGATAPEFFLKLSEETQEKFLREFKACPTVTDKKILALTVYGVSLSTAYRAYSYMTAKTKETS